MRPFQLQAGQAETYKSRNEAIWTKTYKIQT